MDNQTNHSDGLHCLRRTFYSQRNSNARFIYVRIGCSTQKNAPSIQFTTHAQTPNRPDSIEWLLHSHFVASKRWNKIETSVHWHVQGMGAAGGVADSRAEVAGPGSRAHFSYPRPNRLPNFGLSWSSKPSRGRKCWCSWKLDEEGKYPPRFHRFISHTFAHNLGDRMCEAISTWTRPLIDQQRPRCFWFPPSFPIYSLMISTSLMSFSH